MFNYICQIHITMHKSVFHTPYDRMCKSPTTLKKENKLQNHTILLVDSYKKESFQWEIPNFTSKHSQSTSHQYQWDAAALPFYVTRLSMDTLYSLFSLHPMQCEMLSFTYLQCVFCYRATIILVNFFKYLNFYVTFSVFIQTGLCMKLVYFHLD